MALESVGVCELSYEMLKISKSLKTRDIKEFDEVDVWRLMKVAENIVAIVGKFQLLKHLSREEQRVL